MNAVTDKFVAKFNSRFPNSMIHVSKASLSNEDVIRFTLAQSADYPNGIINNDPMYNIIFVGQLPDGRIEIESTLSGLSVNPREKYLAMHTIPTKIRKKTGTVEQVIKHAEKWIDTLHQTVLNNKHDIYGGFDKYQKYIVE
jgi:hypothetical protein